MDKPFFKNYILIAIGLLLVALIWYCKNSSVESDYFTPRIMATHFSGEQFVGSATCVECHADIYRSHIETAHHKTSALASAETIKGSFHEGHNTLTLLDANITMTSDEGSFYERKDFKFGEKKNSVSKIDIVIGSGLKGQSYLSWDKDRLYQLQTSYFSATQDWINSPNFSRHSMTRPISDACLKCHVTFAKNKEVSGNGNHYVKKTIIYGIDCERCHRPAAKHVAFHRKNPEAKKARFMLLTDTLSRQQRLDICAQCHSGLRSQQLKGSPFSFLAGGNLKEHSKNYHTNRPSPKLDVHGNQYGLLTSSSCFKESPNLDCTTCHSPHENQRNDTVHFNQKCISCHNTAQLDRKSPVHDSNKMGQDCIACHMPLLPSETMKVELTDSKVAEPVYIRTHLIGIYQEKSKKTN